MWGLEWEPSGSQHIPTTDSEIQGDCSSKFD